MSSPESTDRLVIAVNNLQDSVDRIADALEAEYGSHGASTQFEPESTTDPQESDSEQSEPSESTSDDTVSVSGSDRLDVYEVLEALDGRNGGTGWSEHVQCVTVGKTDGGEPRIVLNDSWNDMDDDQQDQWRDISGADGPEWISVTQWHEDGYPTEKAVLGTDLVDMRNEVFPTE